eukprot:7912621-Pyramimonas_sp.AAC.1
MLLHTTTLGGKSGERILRRRIVLFDSGDWDKLLWFAEQTIPTTDSTGARQHDNASAKEAKQIENILSLIKQGELSHAARVISSNGLAPGDDNTYAELTDRRLRPEEPSEDLPNNCPQFAPAEPIHLDRNLFAT